MTITIAMTMTISITITITGPYLQGNVQLLALPAHGQEGWFGTYEEKFFDLFG